MIYNRRQPLPCAITEEDFYQNFQKMKQGDNVARNYMIEHNLRLVASIANKYDLSFEVDDLISIGSIGLIKAIDTFQEEKGVRFSIYAGRCIENEILMFIRASSKYKNTSYLDDISEKTIDGELITFNDILLSDIDVELNYLEKEIIEALYDCIQELSDKEQLILKLYYGLLGGTSHTQQQIADILGLSHSGISLIIIKSLVKLKNKLKERGFVESIHYSGQKKITF